MSNGYEELLYSVLLKYYIRYCSVREWTFELKDLLEQPDNW